jgi:hypothetical protein
MAIDVATVQANVKAALKAAMSAAYGEPESAYDELAGILADNIVPAILGEIKNNADVVGVTSGTETVVGGVD